MDVNVPSFHSVFSQSDFEASEPATIDLSCMLVAFIGAKVIVEAGTYRGHWCAAVANAIRLLGREGMVHTADVKDRFSVTLAGESCAPIRPFIRYHQGDFLEMLETITDPIDLAYVDASKRDDPNQRYMHAMEVHGKLRPGGLILIDDTESKEWDGSRQFRVWAKNHGIHLPFHRGLTIIQKEIR